MATKTRTRAAVLQLARLISVCRIGHTRRAAAALVCRSLERGTGTVNLEQVLHPMAKWHVWVWVRAMLN